MDQVLDRISELRDSLAGDVYTPGDDGYEAAKASWNLVVQHQPAAVAVVANEADVQAAVRFASRHNLPIAVQATGHGQFRTCESGLLIVMSRLNACQVDAPNQTAHIQGGAKWGEVIPAMVAKGLVPISGSSPTVGVVGYTLGGGYGLLSRTYGLTVEAVTGFRLVNPQGDLLDVTPESHPDLFWAVLGGGGAYGVVTQISMRLFPHGEMFGGSVMFDASLASQVYPAYVAWTETLPNEVNSAITMMTFPPVPAIPAFLHGRSMLIIAGTALAEPAQAEELWAPIRSLPGAEYDSFAPMTFDKSAEIFRDPVDPLPAHARGVLLTDLDGSVLLEAIGEPSKSPNLMIQLRHLGGAISNDSGMNSVGDRRRAKYVVNFLGIPMGPVTAEMMADHAEAAFAALKPWILSRGPLNWIGERDVKREHLEDVFAPAELARLIAVKQAVDPENRFRYAGVGLD